MSDSKPILGKTIIRGILCCETGLHIGGSQDNLEIGGVDSPVVRDPLTRQPYIPGSSLKGKLRAMLERKSNLKFERHSGQGVYRHECVTPDCVVCRLFGSTGQRREENNLPSRIAVRDLHLSAQSRELLSEIDTGLEYTELKFENSLDRVTASAMPRQIERVPAGSSFDLELVYTVEIEDQEQIAQDLSNIFAMLTLLQDDALGGHGSRGYGRVKIVFESEKSGVLVRKADFYSAKTVQEKEQLEQQFTVSSLQQAQEKCKEIAEYFGERVNV